MLDLQHLPIIDTHTHLFNVDYQEHDLSSILSLSLENPPAEQRRHTLLYRWFLQELALFLNCSPEEKQVLACRKQRMEEDYPGYVQELFSKANICGMVIDVGYKPASVNLEAFQEIVPVQVKYLYRIEAILDQLWDERPPFSQAMEIFEKTLAEETSKPRFIGVKSIIGYRTGLAINLVTEGQARTAYQAGQEKGVRDFFFQQTLRFCKKHQLCFQMHAAFGESNCDLLLNNPCLLKSLLEADEFKDQKIVLCHAGYPRTFETGYLCSVYPNLYCDVSEFVPMVPLGMSKGLADLMDMCPTNKILYGSDGFIIPEFYWFAAVVFRRKLAALLQEIVAQGMYTQEYALEVAKMILYENATSFYGFTI